ncbi:Nif3-like dinuclear metal center hexameric protein [Desulfolutivibrio sp.]|uniref:Nif3-like dinuclear metal center hexameric protein n=1 Tax=Desulfolutivibrio sp. TaxID=2773296 RepID=UPI002F96D380
MSTGKRLLFSRMQIADIIRRIERAADPRHAAAWDRSGIQIAGSVDACEKLAVGLDPTPATVKAALDWGARFILTHHPLLLVPRLPDRRDAYHEVLRLTLSNGAWLYAAHTSLDVRPDGPAGWTMRDFGLANVSVLEPTGPLPDHADPARLPDGLREMGFGLVGDLPAPLPYGAFLDILAGLTGRTFFTLAGRPPENIARAAFCPGSGSDLAQAAAQARADILVTGDLKYHQALEAPLPVLDVGHFCLEERMMRLLADTFAEELGPLGVEVRHFPGRDPLAPCLVGGQTRRKPE